jgi:hypothetical protein
MDLMFESELLPALRDDATLAALESTFTTGATTTPSIFSDFAPQGANLPYIVFHITRSSDDYSAIQKFNIYVDYYDYRQSAVESRQAAERIELLLDGNTLQHERYNSIRIKFFSGGIVAEGDPRSIHYNLLFNARAGRIKACARMTTYGD